MIDIEGWVAKYNTKGHFGARFAPGCFHECANNKVPVTKKPSLLFISEPDSIIGYAELEERPEGLYCICHLNKLVKDTTIEQMAKNGEIKSFSFFAQRVKCENQKNRRTKRKVYTSAYIRAISPDISQIECSTIERITYKKDDDTYVQFIPKKEEQRFNNGPADED